MISGLVIFSPNFSGTVLGLKYRIQIISTSIAPLLWPDCRPCFPLNVFLVSSFRLSLSNLLRFYDPFGSQFVSCFLFCLSLSLICFVPMNPLALSLFLVSSFCLLSLICFVSINLLALNLFLVSSFRLSLSNLLRFYEPFGS